MPTGGAAGGGPPPPGPFARDACTLGGDGDETVDLCGADVDGDAAPLLVAAVRGGARRVLLRRAALPGASAALFARSLLPGGGPCRVSRIDMTDARVGPADLHALLCALRTNPTVTALSLEGCGVDDEGGVVPNLVSASGGALRHLFLARNALGARWGALLGAALQANARLRTLDLRGNRLGGEGCVRVLEGVARHPGLTALSLAHNAATAEAAWGVGDAVRRCTTLFSLSLEGNPLGDAPPHRGDADAAARQKTGGPWEYPGDESVVPLCEALRGGAPLRELSVAGCGLGGDAARCVADALRAQPDACGGVWALSVARNPGFGDAGGAALLARAAARRLRFLSVDGCGCGAECQALINDLVEESTELRGLDVGGAEIDCVGLADVFGRSSRRMGLRALSLRRCRGVGDAGVRTLGGGLREAPQLEALVVDGIGLHGESFGRLCRDLAASGATRRLVQLDACHNPIAATPQVLDGLAAVFQAQPSLQAVRCAAAPVGMHFGAPEVSRKAASALCPAPLAAAAPLRSSAFVRRGGDRARWPGDPRGDVTYRPTALFFCESGVEDPDDDDTVAPTGPPPPQPRPSASWHRRFLYEHAEEVKLPQDVRMVKKYAVSNKQFGGDDDVVDDDPAPERVQVRGTAGRLDKGRLAAARSIGGIVLTDPEMRRAFAKMDTDGSGTVDAVEFREFVSSTVGEFDPTWNEGKIDKALASTGAFDDGVLTYPEFAQLLLHLANL